mgnify:FL=1
MALRGEAKPSAGGDVADTVSRSAGYAARRVFSGVKIAEFMKIVLEFCAVLAYYIA